MQKFFSLIVIALFFSQCNDSSSTSSRNEAMDEIAKAAGEETLKNIKTIAFTFNVQKDSAVVATRKWKWMKDSDEVIAITGADSVRFKRYDSSTADLRKLNADFTNDEYWLIFPFHLASDGGMTIADNGMAKGPVTEDSLHKFTVQYDDKAGFTPGDMYVVYTDPSHKIMEWEFHKSGSAEPSLMTAWEDYEDYNGLKLSSNRPNKDGSFRIFFTDIEVQ